MVKPAGKRETNNKTKSGKHGKGNEKKDNLDNPIDTKGKSISDVAYKPLEIVAVPPREIHNIENVETKYKESSMGQETTGLNINVNQSENVNGVDKVAAAENVGVQESILKETASNEVSVKEKVSEKEKPDDTPEDSKKDEVKETSGTSITGMKQKKLLTYAKHKVDVFLLRPKAKPSGREYTRAVCTLGLRCGTSVLWIEVNGKPAYVWPIVEHVRQETEFGRTQWKIDYTGVRRSPNNMNEIMEFVTESRKRSMSPGSEKKKGRSLQNLFVRFPENEYEHTTEFREKWGDLITKVYNSPPTQRNMYGTNTLAYYAGDLTPEGDLSKRPYLSDYLTIKHTIDALEVAFGRDKNRDEILKDDELLGYYFPKNKFEEVRESEHSRTNRDGDYSAYGVGPTWTAK